MIERLPEVGFSHKKRLNHHCPVCQTENGAVLGCLKYTLLDDCPLANTYDVICCVKCGFVFCDTPSSQDDYDRFYEQYYYSSAYLNREFSADEKKYFEQTLDILAPYLRDKNASIFDIGCGTGRLLERLLTLGYKNLYGVDLSPSCVDLVNKCEGIRAEIGSVASLPLSSIKADVMIVCHIMEHVIELPIALQGIDSKLSEGGLVYVEVPDAMRFGSFKGVSPLRYFYLQHVIHFDETHLCNLFVDNGYQEVKSGHHLRVEGELLMPSVWGIFRKGNAHSGGIKPDFHLARQIKTWFGNVSLDNDDILANLASRNTPVYVWGIGIHIQMMLAMSPLGDCNIKCFVDKDERTQEKTIDGKKIYPLEVLHNANERDAVVIGAPTYSEEMYHYLIEQAGFKGQVIVCGFGDVRLRHH